MLTVNFLSLPALTDDCAYRFRKCVMQRGKETCNLCDNERIIKRFLSNIVHLALTYGQHDMFAELYTDWIKIDNNMINMSLEDFEQYCALSNVDNTLFSTQMGAFVYLHEERQMLLIRHLFYYCVRLNCRLHFVRDFVQYERFYNGEGCGDESNILPKHLLNGIYAIMNNMFHYDTRRIVVDLVKFPLWRDVNEWEFIAHMFDAWTNEVMDDESSKKHKREEVGKQLKKSRV